MRLFVAIDLDETVRDRVIAERDRLMAALATTATSLRPVSPNQLHLTLAFIGEVDDRCAAAIAGRLAADIERPPFTVTLGGTGIFSAGRAPRVLWLGIESGVAALTDLQRLVVRRLSEVGVAVDPKPFSPHLTLGRWRAAGGSRLPRDRRPVSADVIRSALDGPRRADKVERTIAEVIVNEVTLFQSRLSPHGSTHTALARARLS